VLPPDV
jgi:hypothetical protein